MVLPLQQQPRSVQRWFSCCRSFQAIHYPADPRYVDGATDPAAAVLKGLVASGRGPGPAATADEIAHHQCRFEAGWLVVNSQWFELITTSPRCYKLLKKERLLVVSEMIRLPNLKWEKVVRVSPRLGEDSIYTQSEDAHSVIEGCVRDQSV